jgi:NAD(P)H-hydrate epimerase
VLLIGGGPGMPGALRLAGEACLRSGAGLVTVATWPDNLTPIVACRPELIVHGVRTVEELEPLLHAASVAAIGPGLSRTPWARALLQRTLAAPLPLVVDADALNLIAEQHLQVPAGAVLTPHPGEAGRLLGISTEQVQSDRLAALSRLCETHPGAVVVLKGAGTLIGCHAAGEARAPAAVNPALVPGLCERGNPGMAAAGMGDVLTGAIAGILAQCRDPWLAARAGVMAHALSGDELARERERGILALEVAEGLSHWVNFKR